MRETPRRTAPAAARTSERLAVALLGYFAFVTLVITLSPFDFRLRPLAVSYLAVPRDLVANIALFLPIGFLLRSIETSGSRPGWRAVWLAAALSVCIEVAQVFIGSRFASPLDVLTNTLGAYFGVALRKRAERWALWNRQVVGHIGLDIPLVGLLYLLVPQLWLSSVGLVEDAWRSVTTLLLGCAGSIVMVSLHRYRWQGGARVAAHVVPPLALLWFMVGVLPALSGSPQTFGTLALGLIVLTLLMLRSKVEEQRRFEVETLKRFLPVFVVYVVVAALWPPFRAIVPWHGALGFMDGLKDTSIVGILLLLEQVGGFTLLGYALSEWKGRDDRPLAADLPRVTAAAMCLAALLEVAQGFLVGPGASLTRALLATAGAVYGASVYHLARTHVRALRSQQAPAADAERSAAA